ncbi:MAG: MarR family transcriptional regulator [Caldilineaceae bacterium]|nr:MarR family transcriptional regulator [Caldilineaceae bacterium]
MTTAVLAQQVEAVRRFNRFYTKQIGVLQEGLLKSHFPLTEARVLYELAQQEQTTATELGQTLGLDAGYLSRMLSNFEKQGLLVKEPSPTDGRQNLLRLTESGQAEFAKLNARSRQEIRAMLTAHTAAEQQRLVVAMQTIAAILGAPPEKPVAYLLRPHQPGDMGWVVHRQAVLYAQEYGWDERFEALVAEIVAKFIQHFDPQHERCWLAEMNGEVVGSVFLVRHSAEVAKLRLLYVEPTARGLGIGARLVDECIHFARRTGYHKLTLWTNSVLTAARAIYVKAGFQLVASAPHHSFGHDLIGETWDLRL